MKSYELSKKDSKIKDSDLILTLLLKTYFKSLSDYELSQICEDIVVKFNENKQLEKLKNLKKFVFFKKQEDKLNILKYFKEWKSKINLIKFKENASSIYKVNQSIISEQHINNKVNDSNIDGYEKENRIKKIRKFKFKIALNFQYKICNN